MYQLLLLVAFTNALAILLFAIRYIKRTLHDKQTDKFQSGI